jgi:hypothetical protein
MGKRCIADPGHESEWTAAARPEMTASVVVGAAGIHSHRSPSWIATALARCAPSAAISAATRKQLA